MKVGDGSLGSRVCIPQYDHSHDSICDSLAMCLLLSSSPISLSTVLQKLQPARL